MGVTLAGYTTTGWTLSNDQAAVNGREVDGREFPGGGQVVAASAFVFNGAFGSTTSATVTGKETRPLVAITSSGTGQATSAQMTYTFPRAWNVAPKVFIRVTTGTDLGFIVVSVTTTAFVMGVALVPVASTVYTVELALLYI
jgi:hypothetical protein